MDSPDSSRPPSVASHANSAYSFAGSTRHMLTDIEGPLEPPSAPFSSNNAPSIGSASDVSLSVNYIPAKFSASLLTGGSTRKRRGKTGDVLAPAVPKRGGGIEAFRSGEARMPGQGDEDYDGVTGGWLGGGTGKSTPKKLRWNKFKWILFLANILLTTYSIVALIFCLLTWFNIWKHADVIRVGNRPELIFSTVASGFGILTSLIGWAGILLNNRSFLAIYTFFMWITLGLLVTPGYVTYKKHTFNLQGKINAQWSKVLGQSGRARIQTQLSCCGYFSPFVEATVTQMCYSRSILPGCKGPYLAFETLVLKRWYIVAFLIVPVHIGVTVAGLLCSNHVTYRFGKGMMPKAYRMNMDTMAVIMDNYASKLAEEYGTDVASEMLSRSRSNVNLNASISNLEAMPTMPYSSPQRGYHAKYDSLDAKPPPGSPYSTL
ncbi:hypothetical protein L208DRAFT_1400794 [Tricholoma matsutake]|nr:hypothetical protein L208DRAFT_1400794 [Tricholoma matsutake 945]